MSALLETDLHKLLPHQDSQPMPVRDLSVRAVRESDHLRLHYRLAGDLDALRLPAPAAPRRTDGLWRHTCFEAFVGQASGPDYREYNFSPSGAWAAYEFSSYRADMRALEMPAVPDFGVRQHGDVLELSAAIDLRTLRRAGTVRLGVTAVIEDSSGLLSYWALKHPPGKPDFHHADGFVLDVS